MDDELLARARIRKLLEQNEEIQVIAEGSNGNEAVRLINDYKPELAFLDVEMPDKNGFQVLESCNKEVWPVVVFVTAHDRFALKAFKVHAVDYLLKPFDDGRFHEALSHAKGQVQLKEDSVLHEKMVRIMDEYRSSRQENPYILTVRERGRDIKVNLYDVYFIEAEGNYLKLQLRDDRFLVRNTMQVMEEMLDPGCFLRIHRSLIVNTNYLKSKIYKGNNEYAIKMRNGTEFVSGRSFKDSIDRFFA